MKHNALLQHKELQDQAERQGEGMEASGTVCAHAAALARAAALW